MSADASNPGNFSRPLKITVIPAPGFAMPPDNDPHTARIKVPVARVPVSQLDSQPVPPLTSDTSSSINTTALPVLSPTMPPPSGTSPSINTTALPDDPAVLKQMIAELLRALRGERRNREDLQRRLDALLQRLHGPRPKPDNPNQPPLFPDLNDIPPSSPLTPPAPAPDEPASRRGKSKPHGRRRPARNLRREPRRYELTEAERACPECGFTRCEIGVETTEQYDYKPAEVFVIEHQQVKYACPCCQGHVAQAAKPQQPIEKGLPGSGLLAQILVDKYLDHIPLHRSEQRLLRLGAKLSRSTMCDWMAASAKLLMPLWQLLKDHVLQSKVLHTDDTTVPVRDEKRTEFRYGRLWDYIGDAAHPGIVFDYTTTHARDGPATFLKGFKGYLQADAYGAYNGIYTGSKGTIIEVGCWAHGRNKFADAQSSDPERALAAKAWVRRLYDVEDEAKNLSSAERLKLRQEKSVPLLESFYKWLLAQKTQVLPKSPISAAINYVLNQWEALNRYTTDGDLHIDNNVSERTLKLIGMGRINWLFLGSDNGGQTAAVLFSFTATCKHLGVDAFVYLRDVMERLPSHPVERLEELLPHRWQTTRMVPAGLSSEANTKASQI
jgi:transposase